MSVLYLYLPESPFLTHGNSSLILLMTYTILGTLYNRFVLDLHGYDQIPQFSFESMKYHGKEAFEWTRDMAGIIAVNLCSRISTNNGYNIMSSNNPRTPNPVSHQAQVFNANANVEDVEQGNQKNKPAATTPLQDSLIINPVSHQSQAAHSLSFSASSSSQPTTTSQRKIDVPATPNVNLVDYAEEEPDFKLGGDDGEDDGEVPPSSDKLGATDATSHAIL